MGLWGGGERGGCSSFKFSHAIVARVCGAVYVLVSFVFLIFIQVWSASPADKLPPSFFFFSILFFCMCCVSSVAPS